MTKDHFLCRDCGHDLGHRDDVEVGDSLTCEDCGTVYEAFSNDHPRFEVSIRRVERGDPPETRPGYTADGTSGGPVTAVEPDIAEVDASAEEADADE